MKWFALSIAVLLLVSSGSPGLARDRSARGVEEPTRACGHTAELLAARRALAEGDREAALQHLGRARALAAACARDRAPEPEPWTPASAFANASAGVDGLAYSARSNDTSPRI